MSSSPTRGRPEYGDNVLNYELSGLPFFNPSDAYYYLIAAPWRTLIALAFAAYLLINLIFATLYWLEGNAISNAQPGSFMDAFFFSIQTFSTIGYGALGPANFYANILVTIESFIGLVSVAVGTGLIFAKFARPSARVAFSQTVTIHERNGVPTLQFRIANERRSEMLNVNIRASILMEEITAEGQTMRRFHELNLVRNSIPMFSLSFVIMHEITPTSPLYGLTAENIHDRLMLLITSFEGTDTTFLQTVQARYLYRPQQIRFNEQFEDLIGRTADGRLLVQHEKLSLTKPFIVKQNGSSDS